MPLNPYKAPNIDSQSHGGWQTHWYYSIVAPISAIAFWLGVILGILGSMISFAPGDEAYWFAFTSIFIACGLLANGNRYRVVALILLVFCLVATYNGYVSGIERSEFLGTLPN